MDPRAQSTFIPKKPLMDRPAGPVGIVMKPKKTVNFFFLIGIIIFVGSLVLAVGVYVYNLYLNNQIGSLQTQIASIEQKYLASDNSFKNYTRLDQRIKNATTILNAHLSSSAIFNLLEQDTVKYVQFLTFKFGTTGTGTPIVSLTGQARSFNAVSVQSDTLRANGSVRNPIFSNV